jgi:hypothetical protein
MSILAWLWALRAIHNGPSTIGIDTIYNSGGKIPEIFLRGAGVPKPVSGWRAVGAASVS